MKIVTFGEVMLRLKSPERKLFQSPVLKLHSAGEKPMWPYRLPTMGRMPCL